MLEYDCTVGSEFAHLPCSDGGLTLSIKYIGTMQ
jgi:hypothetical protein